MTLSYSTERLELIGLVDIAMVGPGDDLAGIIAQAAITNGASLQDNDVLVIAQKVVSKAEGRQFALDDIEPTVEAIELASATAKDPRLVELILRESNSIVRQVDGLIITEHRLGFVMANAGVDQSNVSDGCALLLPENPDESAAELRHGLKRQSGASVGVIIADSIGRAWRNGIVGHAIGVSGVEALKDLRQTKDMYGRELQVTEVALADEMAAAATLIMGQGSEGIPVVVIRGFGRFESNSSAADLVRDKKRDLFR